ncbi:MAG: FAD-dependent oxidoreductase [bacterium]|nr:FAD-dependent oxidoreductase [bacterium]
MFCSLLILIATNASLAVSAERMECDLLIVGATESGWAAAIQAARGGVKSITIVHDGEWFGGQYTEQALACVDEDKGVGKVGWGVDWHPMKRSFHRSGLFRELMDGIESHNTAKYGSPMPGKPWHGPSTFRPAEAEAVFRKLITPYIDQGVVRVVWNHYPVRAEVTKDQLQGLGFAPVAGGEEDLFVKARLTIDASDWGEAIQTAGAGYECGPDAKSRYSEPSAPADLTDNPPNEMNPITWAMIVEEGDRSASIAKPPHFDDRNYPRATHFSLREFRDLKWDNSKPGLGAITHWPADGKASSRQLSVYSVRRIVDGYSSKTGKTSILLNYMNGQDYPLERLPSRVVKALEATEPGASKKNIVEMTRQQRQIIFDDSKNHSLGVLYHLQNFVHERATHTANSFRNFHLSDEFGTADNLPPKPYIRESLRLKAMYMMREQDGRNRDGETKTKARERFAHVMYPDGLFAWQFHYDFHRTGRTYLTDVGADGPWIDYHKPNRHTKFMSDRSVFPLRSLVPETMDGLLGAQGNVGNSSIVSAAIRLHDQRVHVGQAAGATAVVALAEQVPPRAIPFNRQLLELVRDQLCGDATSETRLLLWPYRDLAPDHASFTAINRLAALSVLPINPRKVDFEPDAIASTDWREQVITGGKFDSQTTESLRRLGKTTSRGAFCQAVWKALKNDGFAKFAFERKAANDADEDGIADSNDPLPFTPNEPITFRIERPEPAKLTPATDGVPSKDSLAAAIRFYDFGGPNRKLDEGAIADQGAPFNADRGFGWSHDMQKNHRKRNRMNGPRDTFLFTRDSDSWSCSLENGDYQVTVCVGDSDHEQLVQRVLVNDETVINDINTAAGEFREATTAVSVRNGRLNVQLGSQKSGSNTCINWLLIEPKPTK